LALSARAIAYKEKIEYSGPMYSSYKIVRSTIEISYTHIGKGLESKSGDLIGFSIAGEDKKFVPATAVIKGNKVEVSSPVISKPLYVRFAWANFPKINLYNKDGLPAVPFRTDVD
jgi:sialate O-acetylesterase